MPQKFDWADNYITAFGLLHPQAANAILSYEYPISRNSFEDLLVGFQNYHAFSHHWYEDTIRPSIYSTGGKTNATYLGFSCSIEGGGSATRPPTNSVFYQRPEAYELDLVETNVAFAVEWLNRRKTNYFENLRTTATAWALDVTPQVLGQVSGIVQSAGRGVWDTTLNFVTGTSGFRPGLDAKASRLSSKQSINESSCAWLRMEVPVTALAMSFDFAFESEDRSGTLQVAIDGINVLSLETCLMQTNVMNSGMIGVSAYCGQKVEFFIGVLDCASTNASLTVSNFQFYSLPEPSLHAMLKGNTIVLSWPSSRAGYSLEARELLKDKSAWVAVTNVPVITNFQRTVTRPSLGRGGMFRLKK